MAWAVKASLKALLGKAVNGSTSTTPGQQFDAAGARVRLTLEMEAAFLGTVEITTDVALEDVLVELHVTNDAEPEPCGNGGAEAE